METVISKTSNGLPAKGLKAGNTVRKAAASLHRLRLLHNQHRWAILLTLVLVLTVQWVATIYWTRVEGEATQQRAEMMLRQLTLSVHDQTQRLMWELNTALQTASYWLTTHPDVDPRTDREFSRLVDIIRDGSNGMIELRLLARNGRVLSIPDKTGGKGLDVADRRYFQKQSGVLTRGMYIGEPLRSRTNGDLVIPVSFPLDLPVSGIIALYASMRLDHIIPKYEEIRFKPNGTIALLRSDGIVLARAPFVENYIGKSIADTYDYLHYLSAEKSGLYTSGNSALDGVVRLVSYTRLTDHPIIVVVSAGGEDTLEAWHQNRRLILLGSAIVSVLLIGAAAATFSIMGLIQESEEQLQRLALYDSLTGWLNRHALDDAADRQFSTAARLGRPLSVLLLDLDHFKRINDTYGHAAGDIVLRKITKLWSGALRGGDVKGRIGGEEFVVILPDTSADDALALAKRLLAIARQAVIRVDGHVIKVTSSIGVATVAPSDNDFATLLRRSDAALYAAKRQGRDRVLGAHEELGAWLD